MCGISIAIHTKNKNVPDDIIRSMNTIISYRGPDDEGFYFGANFAFGHRRLSILDLSAAGHQPMTRNKCLITYNGEVYNYIELRDELKALGHSFQTGTDTEVMLAAYEQWGVLAFEKFNGMWSFALYDEEKQQLIFCRDHFGIKPLYFGKTGDYFVAGSEIKQFTTVPGFTPILNKVTAVNFLSHGWLNYSDATFFEGVNELRPGHYLRYDLQTHSCKVHQWYDLEKAVVPVQVTEEQATAQLKKLFTESVRIRMRSDVQVGSCLSGGIDSSSIITTLHANRLANDAFATVTSCYADKRYDEQIFSDLVTAQTGYRAVKVFPDLRNLWEQGHFDKMIWHQDQPFSTASHYSEFNVFKTAREQAMIVMLDGQGSDEYLCGYGEFFTTYIRELLRDFKWGKAYNELKQKAAHRRTGIITEIKKFLRSAYLYPMLGKIKNLIGKNEYGWLSESWQQLADKNIVRFRDDDTRNLSIDEIVHSSIPYQLHSEDRNSMMFSIESRLPFLDHRLVEYVIGLPSEQKLKNGYTKYILRKALPELPEMIRWRKDKMGFVAPDEQWMKQNSTRVRKELEEVVAHMGIFSPVLLERFDRFVDGKLAYEPVYFRAMAFSRFCSIFKMQVN
jgi:asparagine synthase (glutamine-hydrolysing)